MEVVVAWAVDGGGDVIRSWLVAVVMLAHGCGVWYCLLLQLWWTVLVIVVGREGEARFHVG